MGKYYCEFLKLLVIQHSDAAQSYYFLAWTRVIPHASNHVERHLHALVLSSFVWRSSISDSIFSNCSTWNYIWADIHFRSACKLYNAWMYECSTIVNQYQTFIIVIDQTLAIKEYLTYPPHHWLNMPGYLWIIHQVFFGSQIDSLPNFIHSMVTEAHYHSSNWMISVLFGQGAFQNNLGKNSHEQKSRAIQFLYSKKTTNNNRATL